MIGITGRWGEVVSELSHAMLIAEKEDGGLFLLNSNMTVAQTNWLLDRLKAFLLRPEEYKVVSRV
jgi:hypothetical protein